ncbi:uncharacterized protein G2W53_029035 [Senna tora]|uniref:ATP-dependent DNA helicase n=1 Tax=Senna tora TaxID=362788 RepID=A0A834T4Q5_9FABA|nr:uncharacterized protein G2W53_029035 [Senna tora]
MKDTRSNHFMKEIRSYNNMFAFTSMGGKIDHSVNQGKGPYLIRKRNSDARTYNLPIASEVAALIVGDFDMERGERDIIVENRSGVLQQIDELHPLYLHMQYPLLFPYGKDGYRVETLYKNGSSLDSRKQHNLTLRKHFAYKLQDRRREFNMILRAKKLTKQFIVYAFIMIKAQRTSYIRWLELDKLFKELKCRPEDRPDLLARIFKIKLNRLRRDVAKYMLFSNYRANIHTIEFQKRGLPHAHILLWLAPKHKFTSASQLDSVIFAKIPNPDAHPELYEAVKNYMIHGPCGASRISSPCMVNGKCSKHFPKRFNVKTAFDEDGYAKYHRRHTSVLSFAISLGQSNIYLKRLPFHLSNQQGIVFADNDHIDDVIGNASLKQTKFLVWFEVNRKYPTTRELTYAQFPTKFVFKHDSREWCVRKARYDDACYTMGLLDDDKEYIDGITEASRWSSGVYLRKLFSTLLIHNTIARPVAVGNKLGCIYQIKYICLDLQLDDGRVKDIALAEIEKILISKGRSLADYPPMPLPNDALLCNSDNIMMSEELNYDREFLRTQHSQFSSLTSEQRNIYNMIIDAINRSEGGVFFVNEFGGSGKTFIWNTMTTELCGWGEIVLVVASNGIASQLIPGGRTTHSRFVIPLDSTKSSTYNIMQASDLVNLLLHTKLIIWDEAPMAHRYYFEALYMSLRDIIGYHNPECYKKSFGGKVIVFDSDFRQILPVITRGSRQDIVLSSLNSSYISDSCKVFTLTKNMRLGSGSNEFENQTIYEFSEWIFKIGNGLIGDVLNDEESHITIADDILIHDVQDLIDAIVKSTYPSFMDNYDKHTYIRDRAALAPTLYDVASVNNYILCKVKRVLTSVQIVYVLKTRNLSCQISTLLNSSTQYQVQVCHIMS